VTQYLLDTNILLRISNPSDAQHPLIVNAIATLLARSDECYITPQVLIELWVVATRPTAVNGLGWTSEQTRNIINQLLFRFPLFEESPEIFSNWLDLVTTHQITGKRTHDARIVAAMKASNMIYILTLNPSDFVNIANITPIHPQDI